MTNEQLKDLKDKLWASADQLRANSGLKSTEYAKELERKIAENMQLLVKAYE